MGRYPKVMALKLEEDSSGTCTVDSPTKKRKTVDYIGLKKSKKIDSWGPPTEEQIQKFESESPYKKGHRSLNQEQLYKEFALRTQPKHPSGRFKKNKSLAAAMGRPSTKDKRKRGWVWYDWSQQPYQANQYPPVSSEIVKKWTVKEWTEIWYCPVCNNPQRATSYECLKCWERKHAGTPANPIVRVSRPIGKERADMQKLIPINKRALK